MVDTLLACFSCLDITDVLIQFLQVFLPREVADTGGTRAFSHIEREALAADSLITVGGGIKIGELHRRNLVLTLMTRHDEDIVDFGAFKAIGRQLGIVGDLRVILIEVFGNVDHRLLDQLQVTCTANDDTHRNGIVGFSLSFVELCRDIELSNATREISRTCRQRIDLDFDAWSHNPLFDLNVAGAAIEEGFEGVDITILLDHNTFEGDARNLELTRHLREHDVLTPGTRAIRAPIDVLNRKTLLLREVDLLGIEALQIRHIASQLRERHQCIDLVGEQDGLLFMHTLLVGADLDEKVRA